MIGYQKANYNTVWEIVHCSISHSEEIKYTADNSLSIGEKQDKILKNKPKKPQKNPHKFIIYFVHTLNGQ